LRHGAEQGNDQRTNTETASSNIWGGQTREMHVSDTILEALGPIPKRLQNREVTWKIYVDSGT